jgi:hypothetical protein
MYLNRMPKPPLRQAILKTLIVFYASDIYPEFVVFYLNWSEIYLFL